MFTRFTSSAIGFSVYSNGQGSGDTAKFMRGTFAFDAVARMVKIGGAEPIPFPDEIDLFDGLVLPVRLYDEASGDAKKQSRDLTLKLNEKTGLFIAAGRPTTPALFTEEQGWQRKTYRFRAYFTHPGIETDSSMPGWLQDYIDKGRTAWNSMAALCRERRRQCFGPNQDDLRRAMEDLRRRAAKLGNVPFPDKVKGQNVTVVDHFLSVSDFEHYVRHLENLKTENPSIEAGFAKEILSEVRALPSIRTELAAFRDQLVEIIDEFNSSVVDSKDKIVYPKGANKEHLSLSPFLRYASYLKYLAKDRHPVPDSLLEMVEDFIDGIKARIDYTPINDFQKNYSALFDERVEEIGLMTDQRRQIKDQIKKVLDRRKKFAKQLGFDQGWPKIRYKEDGYDWEIKSHVNSAGVSINKVLAPCGAAGLRIGHAANPNDTGHPNLKSLSYKEVRSLRPASITVAKQSYRFAVLLHKVRAKRADDPMRSEIFPDDCHIKEWHLVGKGQDLWLCISALVKMPVSDSVEQPVSAGFDAGWRSMPDGTFRIGTLYAPGIGYKHVSVDFSSVSHAADSQDLKIHLGPTRWGMRNIKNGTLDDAGTETTQEIKQVCASIEDGLLSQDRLVSRVSALFSVSQKFIFVDTLQGILHIQARRSQLAQLMKVFLKASMGAAAPAWLASAGSTGLKKLLADEELSKLLTSDERHLLQSWVSLDTLFGERYSYIWGRVRSRRDTEYRRVAHIIFEMLQKAGVHELAVEAKWVQQTINSVDKYSDPALRNSQKYRQWIAPATLVDYLRQVSVKTPIRLKVKEAANTTSKCSACGHKNVVGPDRMIRCENEECALYVDQDQNAAKNLAMSSSSSVT